MLPISEQHLNDIIQRLGITDVRTATIRQICALAAVLEKEAGETFIHLEIGNPGLPPSILGMSAERDALRDGIVNRYPNIAGIPELKKGGSEFVKAFLDLDIDPSCIVPTVGSMQGSFTMMLLLKQRIPGKDTMLFLHPGFPAQANQAKILGMETVSLDIFDCRGSKLREALEDVLSSGRVTGMIYSNPNNPAWTNFTEDELRIIGEMADKYDVIVMEDLAYMGMDFREYAGEPYKAPYVPTVGRYTENYILLISASKIFSYAGQRIAILCMSDSVYKRKYPYLEEFYEMPNFGEAYIFGILYTASSGTSHSSQFAMAAMLEAACKGELDFVSDSSEYARRGKKAKEIFEKHGFHIVYSDDAGRPISDGFFFTAGYGDMTGDELQLGLLRHGVASISLPCTGSRQNGVRVCISVIGSDDDFETLDQRLKRFSDDYPKKA